MTLWVCAQHALARFRQLSKNPIVSIRLLFLGFILSTSGFYLSFFPGEERNDYYYLSGIVLLVTGTIVAAIAYCAFWFWRIKILRARYRYNKKRWSPPPH